MKIQFEKSKIKSVSIVSEIYRLNENRRYAIYYMKRLSMGLFFFTAQVNKSS